VSFHWKWIVTCQTVIVTCQTVIVKWIVTCQTVIVNCDNQTQQYVALSGKPQAKIKWVIVV
jgi:hypothetical protein